MTDFYDTENEEYRPFEGQGGRADVDPRLTSDTATTITLLAGPTAQVLFSANQDRIGFSVYLVGGNSSTDCHIRYYAAVTDDLTHGAGMLSRSASANKGLFQQSFTMTESAIYTGEISIITELGSVLVAATEY